jgi:hypothetical protein
MAVPFGGVLPGEIEATNRSGSSRRAPAAHAENRLFGRCGRPGGGGREQEQRARKVGIKYRCDDLFANRWLKESLTSK